MGLHGLLHFYLYLYSVIHNFKSRINGANIYLRSVAMLALIRQAFND
jgi:hypothetical protein